MKSKEHRTLYTFSSLSVTGSYSFSLSGSAIHLNKIISSTLVVSEVCLVCKNQNQFGGECCGGEAVHDCWGR